MNLVSYCSDAYKVDFLLKQNLGEMSKGQRGAGSHIHLSFHSPFPFREVCPLFYAYK